MVAVAAEAAFQGAEAMVEVAMAVGATTGVQAATVGASVAAVASPGRNSTRASGAAESSAAKSDRQPDRGRAQVSAVYIPYGEPPQKDIHGVCVLRNAYESPVGEPAKCRGEV